MNYRVAEGTPSNPIAAMIQPGRRALGEDWNRTTVHWDPDIGDYVTRTEPSPRPADGKAIILPTLGNVSWDMVNFILDYQMKEAEYRAAAGNQDIPDEELSVKVNRMWQDYMQEKLKWFQGQTQVGPGGMHQREKVNG